MQPLLQLWKIKLKQIRNSFRFGKESKFKVFIITLFVIFFLGGIFLLFREGFQFLLTIPFLGIFVMDRLLYFFFLLTFFLLIFSSIVVSYTTLYSPGETDFFFYLPLSHRVIFSQKFLETLFYSSWSFVFLGFPLLASYGLSRELPLSFYILSLFLFFPFSLITTSLGVIFILLLMKVFSLNKWKIYLVGGAVLSIPIFYFIYKVISLPPLEKDLFLFMKQIFGHFRLSQHPYLPSYWVSRSLFAFIHKEMNCFWKFTLLLFFTSLLLCGVSTFLAGKLYFDGWSNSRGGIRERPVYKGRFIPERWEKTFSWIPSPYRALLFKDIKVFFRDPRQWSQFLIFFGVLGFYILNLRYYRWMRVTLYWKYMISFLNIAAMGFVLSTLTTRFMFPLMSLEGKRIWILGLTPLSLDKVFKEKFLFTFLISYLITGFLTNLSNFMLDSPRMILFISNLVIVLMSLSLSSLSVSLGAIFPKFNSENPAQIVSGFGGTLNFFLGIIYVILVSALLALPLYLHFVAGRLSGSSFCRLINLSLFWIIGMSGAVTWIPFKMAVKKVKEMEF